MPVTPRAEDGRIAAMPYEFMRGAANWSSRAIRALMIADHPFYASLTREVIHDADLPSEEERAHQHENFGPDDPLDRRELPASFEWVIDYRGILEFDTGALLTMLFEAASALANQIESGVIQHISDITDATGNVVDASGRDFAEAMLDVLESMTFSFDESGQPNVTIVLHPDQALKYHGAKFTPEQQARHDRIISRKRDEWNASQRRRELPGLSNGA